MSWRPWLCPERERCSPLTNLRDGEYRDIGIPEPGQSWVCFGKMTQPIDFSYDGVDHTNSVRSCHYSPLKGLIQFHETPEDWSIMASGYRAAILALERGDVHL